VVFLEAGLYTGELAGVRRDQYATRGADRGNLPIGPMWLRQDGEFRRMD
jgi:hypothetical protein